ncbi:hypothetical protein ID866_7060 [Astraeus odoratus]|nr:hypothetical protein ID866_7060 [Astraeus odoratus]
MVSFATCINICLATIVVCYLLRRVFKRNPAPYPPGPKPLPLLGNLRDLPSVKPWLTYAEWGAKFGDVTHVQVFGRHIIFLNSVKAAVDMLDKKGFKYSDRPVLPMAGELLGNKFSLPLLPYGDRFRETRKQFHRVIGTRAAVGAYYDVETSHMRKFLKRVLADPEGLSTHIRTTIGTIMLSITYGYQAKEEKDYFIELTDQVADIFTKATVPGAFLVDVIPMLMYVPEWFPGASFKRKAREWRMMFDELTMRPYEFVKNQMAAGTASKSFTSTLLEEQIANPSNEKADIIKWSATSFFGGGADTTVSAMYTLFLAMTLYPDIQRTAQAEIDAVVGFDRLPSFSDRDSLPYVEALVKEILRWHAVTPLGFPHCVSEDDIYDGHYIPKGSLVIPNVWFMLHDPCIYSHPMEFRPERFLMHEGKSPENDPRSACFGFGRRSDYTVIGCMHLAEASLWLMAAMSLAAFDISKFAEDGVEITPEVDPSSQVISHHKPFKCSIKPRSPRALELIQQDI